MFSINHGMRYLVDDFCSFLNAIFEALFFLYCNIFLIFFRILFCLPCFSLKQVDRRYGWKEFLILAYQSLGVLFGDLSISPLYVFKSTFSGRLSNYQSEEVILGAFSLIFWTLTLLSFVKYVFIMLNADDNGQGKGPNFLDLVSLQQGCFVI